MITEKQQSERLRRQRDLKARYKIQLDNAKTDAERTHLEARIAEIVSKMKPVLLPEPKALLPKITKTTVEEHKVQPLKTKSPRPKLERKKVKNAGNPF